MKITALNSNAPNFEFNDRNTLKGCMKYIAQYFIPLKDGNIAIFEDDKYVIKDDVIVRKVYFNRMPEYDIGMEDGVKSTLSFSNWFFKNTPTFVPLHTNSIKTCFMIVKLIFVLE